MRVFGVMIAHNARNFELARVFTREIPFAEGARHGVKEVMESFHRRMEALIVEAQDAGEVRFGRGAGEARPQPLGAVLSLSGALARQRSRSPDSDSAEPARDARGPATRRTRRLAKAVFAFAKFFMGDAASRFRSGAVHWRGLQNVHPKLLFSPA